MSSTDALVRGANAAVAGPRVVVSAPAANSALVDVSAVLLGANGKVRSDQDLVFFNNPRHAGVTAEANAVSADLQQIPSDVHTVAVVASIDTENHPGATFATAGIPAVQVLHAGGSLAFSTPPLTAGETVAVLVELYRRGDSWKVRAVGQGWDTGLAGLATDFGIDVDPPAEPAPASIAAVPPSVPVSLEKVKQRAPGLLPAYRQAAQAIDAVGLTGARAAVYLVLAHSWQEKDYYENRTMQAFAEKVLALSAHLDDDGTVPLVFATGREPFVEEISLDNYKGLVAALHTQMDWSWDGTSIAMRAVIDHYENSGATDPALVIYQVGGEPDEKSDVRTLLRNTAGMNIYWHFEGFGASKDFTF